MWQALVPGPFQRLAQFRRLLCQHRDDLVQVAVGGGPGDAMVAGQRISGGAVAEPAQAQDRLPEAGQCPAAAGGAPAAAFGCQQLRRELGQFPGDVERGTIGDHVEPFSGTGSCGETSSLGLHACFLAVRLSACLPGHPRWEIKDVNNCEYSLESPTCLIWRAP